MITKPQSTIIQRGLNVPGNGKGILLNRQSIQLAAPPISSVQPQMIPLNYYQPNRAIINPGIRTLNSVNTNKLVFAIVPERKESTEPLDKEEDEEEPVKIKDVSGDEENIWRKRRCFSNVTQKKKLNSIIFIFLTCKILLEK